MQCKEQLESETSQCDKHSKDIIFCYCSRARTDVVWQELEKLSARQYNTQDGGKAKRWTLKTKGFL